MDSTKLLSDVVVYSKYARYLPSLKRRETWEELVTRSAHMHAEKYPEIEDEIYDNFASYVIEKKVFPSMRSLQFAGGAIKKTPSRIFNCSYMPVESIYAFNEAMFLLLGGTGLGISVKGHHIDKLPDLIGVNRTRAKRYLVTDSIEGWADAIKVLVESYFKGKKEIRFDFSDIRHKGAYLVTAGGKAPGPQPLKDAIHNIRKVLDTAIEDRGARTRLKPIEAFDIMCHIADAVLAGGIRRAAIITLFSPEDHEMLGAKSGSWWELNPQRGRSNNSVSFNRHELDKEVFDVAWEYTEKSGAGEPGIILTNDKDWGINPCFTGDMYLLTSNGYKTFLELNDDEVDLVSPEGDIYSGRVWSNGVKKVIKIKDSLGRVFRQTPDHVYRTVDGEECMAKDLLGKSMMPYWRDIINNLDEYTVPTIISVEDDGEEEVFDFTIRSKDHWGVVSSTPNGVGVVAHNCAEISLSPYQFCNLTTINVSDVDNQDELNNRVRAASFIGTLQAGYTDFHYLRSIWKRQTEQDALLGVSMTGIGSGAVLGLDLKEAARIAVEENVRVAKLIGINRASRVTAIKPEGTASLVAGTSSGIHAFHAPYYLRRIRVNKNEALYGYLKDKLSDSLLCDDYFSPDTTAVLTFPIKAPASAVFRDEHELDLLERVKRWNIEWVWEGHYKGVNKNNVSCTISIKPENWKLVREWMWENRDYYTGMSVLPYDGGTYIMPPFEDCTEETYNKLIAEYKNVSIDLTEIIEEENSVSFTSEGACQGGNCEVGQV